MDRRANPRVFPRNSCSIRLVLPSMTLNGVVWNASETGAGLFFEKGSARLDPQVLRGFLDGDSPLLLRLEGREHPASLVWFGAVRSEKPAQRAAGIAAGVRFAGPFPVVDLLTGGGTPVTLHPSHVVHRRNSEVGGATALRDLLLAVGSAEFSLTSALQLLCDKSRELIGAELADFWALEGERATLRARSAQTLVRPLPSSPLRPGSAADAFSAYLPRIFASLKARLQKGEQLFTNDLGSSPLVKHPWVRRYGASSAMMIPVFGREADLGALVFGSSQDPFAFGPREQAMAEIFTGPAALFFEKATMLRNLQDSTAFLRAMNHIGLALHRQLDLSELLEIVSRETRDLFQVDIVAIFLREGSGYALRAAVGIPTVPRWFSQSESILPDWHPGRRGEAFFINHFDAQPFAQLEIVKRYTGPEPPRSLLGIPIRDNDEALGALALLDRRNPERFTARDVERGKLLAEQVAQAIVNARLYDRVVQAKRIMRQQDRFRILGELAGVVSHEIKNALVPLRAVVELLPGRYEDPGFREWYAKTVRQEIDRMQDLVGQLNRFRRAENRVVEATDPASLLRSVVDLLQTEAVGRQIQLELETEPDLPVIEMVPNEIRQVLLNLILNAVQAVEEKGVVRVGVRRAEGNREVAFWVSDTGPGIPPDDVEKIFDPLFTTKPNGSGLGLAVARDLVQSHGGTIDVKSTPGSGATFVVSIPL